MIWSLLIMAPDGETGAVRFPHEWHTRAQCVVASMESHKVRANDTLCVGREGKLLNAQVTQLNPTEDDTTDVHHTR